MLPAVIVPLVIVQVYVPPAALVMLAVLPVELAHTAVAAEMLGVAGMAFTVTDVVAQVELPQPLLQRT